MEEEFNPVGNICPQTKRFRTATVRAKILNTERLNHIGLDMTELRCKDLANFKCCIGSQPLNLSKNVFCDSPNNQSDCFHIRNQDCFGSVFSCNKNSNGCKKPHFLQGLEDRDSNDDDLSASHVSLTMCNHKHSTIGENARESNQHFLAKQSTKKFASRFLNFQMGSLQIDNSATNLEGKLEEPGHFTKNCLPSYDSTRKSNKDSNDIQTKVKVSESKSNGWLFFIECPDENPMIQFKNEKEIAPCQRFQKCNICGNSYGTAGFKIHQPRCSQIKQIDVNQHKQDIGMLKKAHIGHQVQRQAKERFLAKNENTYFKDKKEIANTSRAQSKFIPIICDICNRQFGSQSISIHRPQCLKKWILINADAPLTLQ